MCAVGFWATNYNPGGLNDEDNLSRLQHVTMWMYRCGKLFVYLPFCWNFVKMKTLLVAAGTCDDARSAMCYLKL